jgi:poly(ADP-ribose) glycohydrolase ARH3
MIGSAVGDAIGELAFSYPEEQALLRKVDRGDMLRYTDDTAMAIGLAESIAALGRIEPRHLGDTFRAHFRREPWRGYAAGPPTVFAQVEEEGISYRNAARRLYGGQGSFGNGAAMRIVALGLFFHAAPDLYDQARLSAEVTHAHPIGIDGAAVQARAVAQVVDHDPAERLSAEDFVQTLLNTARTAEMRQQLAHVGQLLRLSASSERAAVVLGQGVAVQRSLPFAIFCFLRHPASFRDCLFCAALNGGDRDTLGAMACAISGAYLGLDAIPTAWQQRLENRERIVELAARLARTATV